MTNNYCRVLVAILISSTCLTAEGGQSQPSVAIITGEIREPISREITFGYESPLALGRKSEQRVVLDSRNRFALDAACHPGTLVRGVTRAGSPDGSGCGGWGPTCSGLPAPWPFSWNPGTVCMSS